MRVFGIPYYCHTNHRREKWRGEIFVQPLRRGGRRRGDSLANPRPPSEQRWVTYSVSTTEIMAGIIIEILGELAASTVDHRTFLEFSIGKNVWRSTVKSFPWLSSHVWWDKPAGFSLRTSYHPGVLCCTWATPERVTSTEQQSSNRVKHGCGLHYLLWRSRLPFAAAVYS